MEKLHKLFPETPPLKHPVTLSLKGIDAWMKATEAERNVMVAIVESMFEMPERYGIPDPFFDARCLWADSNGLPRELAEFNACLARLAELKLIHYLRWDEYQVNPFYLWWCPLADLPKVRARAQNKVSRHRRLERHGLSK